MSLILEPLKGPLADRLDKYFGVKGSLIEITPSKCVLPPLYEKIWKQILDAPVREDDVWLLSYPRTGSTWTQEMVWLIGNDFNYEEAKKNTQHTRAPLIELSGIMVDYSALIEDKYGTSVDGVNNLPSPRYIKSHLPLELLPTQLDKVKPKIIYIARNPKDMCISYYHYCQLVHNMNCTLEEFCEVLLNDRAPIGPIWRHFLTFWNKRHEPNVHFLKYEDLKRDLKGNIRKMAEFLEKPITDEQVDRLAEHLSFQNMRNNPAVNLQPIIDLKNGKDYYKRTGKNFIRKGEVGDWKNTLSPEMIMRFDKWIEENTRGTGLSFD